ncbi:hypothetical protein KSS87_013057 [Heliosperma pusillum]|nr:hypothetical protein KSS87_013057 [Heliosperma pusillum]
MTRLFSKSLVKLSLIIQIIISLYLTTTSAQTCKGFTFQKNKLFATCNDLPFLGSYLYWTYNSTTGTADIAFRATGVNPSSNWVAWALNPTGHGMLGAQTLVAFQGSSGAPMSAYTSSISPTSYGTTLQNSSISFAVTKLSAENSGSEIIIFATIKPPTTTVNQVWQVGPLSGGNPSGHQQSGANILSSGSIDFLTGQSIADGSGGGSRQKNKNIHGVLNAISWGTLMPLGAIIARYLRVFKSANPAWFYMHIACQCSAYILGVSGWGLGLKLGSESVGIVYEAHRNIGIALFCLATLQVFALFLRTHKDSKYRIYWNVYHHATGYSVIILSVINIYKGFDILEPLKKWKTTYTAIIIILGVIALLLEAFTWAVVLKRKKNADKNGHHANGHTNGTNPFGHGPFRHAVKKAFTREELEGMDVMEDMRDYAITVINQYNNITQKGKLALERIIKVTCINEDGNNIFYMTFYAMDMESNTQGAYQAAMVELKGQQLLGLLKDYSNNNVLAILSLKGCEPVGRLWEPEVA